jgi:hypothetical protein
MTTSIRRVVIALLCLATYPSLGAQRRTDYRTYRMGDDVMAIARQIGLPSPAATAPRVLGPVLELKWRVQYVRGGTPANDPVALLVFSFYDDQLFQIVIDYSPDRTEAMTEADMVAAVSRVYGAPAKRTDPPSPVGLHPQRPTDSVVAQWMNGELLVALLSIGDQTALSIGDQTAFRMIVASIPLEGLASRAGASEASADIGDWASIGGGRPAGGIERGGAAREKIRLANIAAFVP